MWSIPVLLCVIVLGALGASFWVWTQRKNHSTDISRLQTGRTDEIDWAGCTIVTIERPS
jgi:hypothetical protein